MLVLVDGTSLFNACFFSTMPRSYFAAKSSRERFRAMSRVMRSPSGEMVNGVYGMTKLLFALIEKVQPSHMVVVWGSSQDIFRQQLYSGYRANRSVVLPEVRKQLVLMRRLLDELGVCQYSVDSYESCDVVATLVSCCTNNIEACVYSKDTNLLQVVASNVRFWLYSKRVPELYLEHFDVRHPEMLPVDTFEYTEDLVKCIYGIEPKLLADVKALSGDRSCNIPGLTGIGDKTALRLVKAFGAIEEMYVFLEQLTYEERVIEFKKHGLTVTLLDKLFEDEEGKGEDNVSNNMLLGKKAVYLSKNLSVLCRDVPMAVGLSDMLLPRLDRLPAIISELGFNLLPPKREVCEQQVLF